MRTTVLTSLFAIALVTAACGNDAAPAAVPGTTIEAPPAAAAEPSPIAVKVCELAPVEEENTIFFRKGATWVAIRLVRLNDPAANREPLREFARKVGSRM